MAAPEFLEMRGLEGAFWFGGGARRLVLKQYVRTKLTEDIVVALGETTLMIIVEGAKGTPWHHHH